MALIALTQCPTDIVSRFVAWYVDAGSLQDGPHEALLAIASVSAVVWTGGLLLRDRLNGNSANMDLLRLNVAMDALQTSFVGALIALLAEPLALRSIAFAAFAYYGIAHIYFGLKGRNLRWWLLGELFVDVAMLTVALRPERGVAAWATLLLLALGYQLMLKLFYRLHDLKADPFAAPLTPTRPS